MSRLRIVALLVTLVPLAIGGCSSAANGSEGEADTSSGMHDMAGMTGMTGMPGMSDPASSTETGKVNCAQHMPGDVLTAEEAMVIFDTEHVCLGYVTVAQGTAITWHNTDDLEQRVIVEDENGTELMTFDIVPGGATQRALKDVGVYRYRLSAIAAFVGTIEVQAR
jgi:hypothetical protein